MREAHAAVGPQRARLHIETNVAAAHTGSHFKDILHLLRLDRICTNMYLTVHRVNMFGDADAKEANH